MRALVRYFLVVAVAPILAWVVLWLAIKLAVEGPGQKALGSSRLAVSGFPAQVIIRAMDIRLDRPSPGLDWLQARDLSLRHDLRQPLQLALKLPREVRWAQGQAVFALRTDGGQAEIGLGAALSLPLQSVRAEASTMALALDHQPLWQAKGLVAELTKTQTQTPGHYLLQLDLDSLLADPALGLGPLGGDGGLSDLAVRAELQLGAPLDRHAMGGGTHLAAVDLSALSARLGPAGLTARGAVQADEQGFAMGRLDITIEKWPALLALLQEAGLIPPAQAQAMARALTAAELAGQPGTARLVLKLQGGMIWLGFVPLGPAPRLR